MRPHLLEKQIQEEELSVEERKRIKSSSTSKSSSWNAYSYALPLTLEACQCRHLERWLPQRLDLETIPNEDGTAHQVVNPIHALHLEAHMEYDGRVAGNILNNCLYGDEQRRTDALTAAGISDSYCQLVPSKSPEQPRLTKFKTFHSTTAKRSTPSSGTSASYGFSTTLQPNNVLSTAGAGTTEPVPSSAGGSTTGTNNAPVRKGGQPPPAVVSSVGNPLDSTAPPSLQHLSKTQQQAVQPSIVTSASPAPFLVSSSPNATEPIPSQTVSAAGAPPVTAFDQPAKLEASSSVLPHSNSTTDAKTQLLRQKENKILLLRQNIFGRRKTTKRKRDSSSSHSTSSLSKSKGMLTLSSTSLASSSSASLARSTNSSGSGGFSATGTASASVLLASLLANGGKTVEVIDQQAWNEEAARGRSKTEGWLEYFRHSRIKYYQRREHRKKAEGSLILSSAAATPTTFPGCTSESTQPSLGIDCQLCVRKRIKQATRTNKKSSSQKIDDDCLMQCLECSFVGCGPASNTPGRPSSSKHHIVHHLLATNHSFAVSCGARASLYCFQCGDFVSHQVFDQERERLDIMHELPQMGWEAHPILRSMDPFQFLVSPDYSVTWRGMMASYPRTVSKDHLEIARLMKLRKDVFRGRVSQVSLRAWNQNFSAMEFAIFQRELLRKGSNYWRLPRPIGLFNLSNTCYMNCVVQCLLHCPPLQRFFLLDVGHDHQACRHVRNSTVGDAGNDGDHPKDKKKAIDICVACEFDLLVLRSYGSVHGKDVLGIWDNSSSASSSSNNNNNSHGIRRFIDCEFGTRERGLPLIPTDLLSATWRSGGMNHMAGYEQRDCHEFLQAFLDVMSKDIIKFQNRVSGMLKATDHSSPTGAHLPGFTRTSQQADEEGRWPGDDVIKRLFEGTLRSVSICEVCGNKRTLSEPFLNISLSLSNRKSLSVEKCLKQFTQLESLEAPIDCPNCAKKTSTKRQHTFAKLPVILCLHLKRFDAASNKKIADFVEFPATDFDMGPHLPHWSEVVHGTHGLVLDDSDDSLSPNVIYDLFGTVDHAGTMNQGHYFSNVKIDDNWYHCNDAHVYSTTEEEVVKSDGAYLLFYIRRSSHRSNG